MERRTVTLAPNILNLTNGSPAPPAVARKIVPGRAVRRHILSLPIGVTHQNFPPHLDPILEEANSLRPLATPFSIPQAVVPSSPSISEENPISLASSKQISMSMPRIQVYRPISDVPFEEAMLDPTIVISPRRLGFIPASSWTADSITFGNLVASFFRRRNSTSSKFPFKLYNALRISECFPAFFPHVGVRWINDEIIWVDREAFARLIGVKTIEGGLFHQQGNFPSHGFVELSFEESEAVSHQYNLGKIDLSVMRMVKHINRVFVRGCTEADIEMCKWKGA